MYTMKQVCDQVGLSYETLRFYCNEGLVPNVQRDEHNYRRFDDKNIAWLNSLQCLKRCGMGLHEMKQYLALCLQGAATIPERRKMLALQREFLVHKMAELQQSIQFIDEKQEFYDGVLNGTLPYTSNLLQDTPCIHKRTETESTGGIPLETNPAL